MGSNSDDHLYMIEQSAWPVRGIPEGLRPREEMERVGAPNVSDAVLLAIILRSGIRGVNVVDLAQGLLRHFGSLNAIAGSSVAELARFPGMGKVKAQIVLAALEFGQRLSSETMPDRPRIRTPEDAARTLRKEARGVEKETFWVLHLDPKNRMKRDPEVITRGLLDASLVHPREVFREAIRAASAAIVLVHNHPSGDPAPSAEDVKVTKQLVQSGRILDINILDHVILGRPQEGRNSDYVSLREEGVVDFGS